MNEYILHFRVLLFLFLFWCLSRFSSLGAGLGKRTQKPLGAHQERVFDRYEREHSSFAIYNQITNRLSFPALENST
jgi:hypothetical protein